MDFLPDFPARKRDCFHRPRSRRRCAPADSPRRAGFPWAEAPAAPPRGTDGRASADTSFRRAW